MKHTIIIIIGKNATCTCTYLVKFIIECTLVKLTSSTVYGIFLVSILRTAATASGLKSPVPFHPFYYKTEHT